MEKRPMLSEGDCFLIDKVLSERINSERDRILVKALQETLRRLRALVESKKKGPPDHSDGPVCGLDSRLLH